MAKFTRQRLGRGVALALVMTFICQAFGTPQGFDTIARADQSKLQMDLALDFIQHHVTSSDVIFMDHLTDLQFGHYLCHERPISFDQSVAGFETFRCDGYKVISNRKIGLFDSGNFLSSWEDMLRAYDLRTGQAVWVIQAGLGGDLADQLRTRFPEFSELHSVSFGHHIQIFKVTVGQSGIVSISSAPFSLLRLQRAGTA